MNREAAKQILILYRPGTADMADPQTAVALALAKQDAELSLWLEKYLAQQESLRAKFRQIAPPEGLKQQIISEHAAEMRTMSRRRTLALVAVAVVMLCAGLLAVWRPAQENDLAKYRSRMVRVAMTGYAMELETGNMAQIRGFLAGHGAPSDFALPAGLWNVTVTGCAVEKWNDRKVAMVCFRTGQPLAPGAQSDLWLFIIDRTALKNAPDSKLPEMEKVNRLITATWMEGNKIYLLGVSGDEQTVRQYL